METPDPKGRFAASGIEGRETGAAIWRPRAKVSAIDQ